MLILLQMTLQNTSMKQLYWCAPGEIPSICQVVTKHTLPMIPQDIELDYLVLNRGATVFRIVSIMVAFRLSKIKA